MNEKPTYMFLDNEATGFSPLKNHLISLGLVVTDQNHNILGKLYEECNLGGPRWHKNPRGFEVDEWNDQAEKVHGLSWEYIKEQQHPLDLCRKVYKFIHDFNSDLKMVYHANSAYDEQFFFSHFARWTDKGFYLLQKHVLRGHCDNTMHMARAYNKQGSMGLTELKKWEKQHNKYLNLLHKDRKTPPTKAKMREWQDKVDHAQVMMSQTDIQKVDFGGKVGLADLCKVLDVPLNHHNALSDAEALVPIHKFLLEHI